MANEMNPNIIVFTMGKVASTAIAQSLRAAGLPAYDIHSLAPQRIMVRMEEEFSNPERRTVPNHVINSIKVHNDIARFKRNRVISLIREPVMRNISAVFQNLPSRLADDFDEIVARLQRYQPNIPDFWFEKDFIPTIGIDVLSGDVDATSDHFKFSNDRFDVLILKMDASDARKSAIVSDFVGEDVHVIRQNEAQDKWYSDSYAKIGKSLDLMGSNYLETCFSLRYFRKFFSDEERAAVAEKFKYGGAI